MVKPSFFEQSENTGIPKPKLPGQILNSLNELKDHVFDPESNAPAFYCSKHQLSGSGVRNLTAKAFSLQTKQVSNTEAWFSLTISNLLIDQVAKRTVCSMYAPCSKQQAFATINIWTHTCSYIRRRFSKILSIWTKWCCI